MRFVLITASLLTAICLTTPAYAGDADARLDALREQLGSASITDRYNAANELARMGGGAEAAIPALIGCLSNDYCSECIDALAAIGEAAIDPLVEALRSDDIYVRTNALSALKEIGPPAIRVQDSIIVMLDDPASMVSSNARWVLHNLDTDKAREAVARYDKAVETMLDEASAEYEEQFRKIYTKDDIQADLPAAPDYKYPLTLQDYQEIPMKSGITFIVTLHSGEDRMDRAAVYSCSDTGCILIHKQSERSEDDQVSYLLEPVHFQYNNMQFIEIVEMYYGTGFFRDYYIYHLDESGGISEVEYVSPCEAYQDQLQPGEGVWKGVGISLTNDGLTFGFEIWNDGDANCCPTAGDVEGRFDIVEENAPGNSGPVKLKMIPVEFVRRPVED